MHKIDYELEGLCYIPTDWRNQDSLLSKSSISSSVTINLITSNYKGTKFKH